jgi:hypothetical protein
MQAELVKLSEIKPNTSNPRTIKDVKFKQLVQSIKDFPEMLQLRPIVVDEEMVILGGNMRFAACKDAGLSEVYIIKATALTEQQKQEFIIKDNVGFGEWDWDILANEWNTDDLLNWGLELPFFDDSKSLLTGEATSSLKDRFIIPPFSILDTRQGYWQSRKRHWNTLIGDNGESREETLFRSKGNPVSDALRTMKNGVSILDAVLAELSNAWFGLPNGNTFDCFAGDSVFGFVSSYLGNNFTGIELRPEQTALNNERVKDMSATYICDDGRNVLTHIEPKSQDLLFSCPPYFNLEVYSDMENDASNQDSYEDFIELLNTAFSNAIHCLKDNRFAVITVGDVRDKNGCYYRFVDDVKNIFCNNGMKLYNELILVEAIGGARLRVNGMMKSRKVPKTHQNILVFFNGDTKQISKLYPQLDFSDIENEIIEDEE